MQSTIEETDKFTPKYAPDGLIPCIAVDHLTGNVLMLAYMNEASINKTLETGEAHYYSRSRQEIWHKGATSGNTQKVIKMLTDCDQDCLIIHVEMPKQDNGNISACHTGRDTCFYRTINYSNGSITLEKNY